MSSDRCLAESLQPFSYSMRIGTLKVMKSEIGTFNAMVSEIQYQYHLTHMYINILSLYGTLLHDDLQLVEGGENNRLKSHRDLYNL